MVAISNDLIWNISAKDQFSGTMQAVTNQTIRQTAHMHGAAKRAGTGIVSSFITPFTSGLGRIDGFLRTVAGKLLRIHSMHGPPAWFTLLTGGAAIYGMSRLLDRMDKIQDVTKAFTTLTKGSANEVRGWSKELANMTGGLLTMTSSLQLANQLLGQGLALNEIGKIFEYARIRAEMFGQSFEEVVNTIGHAMAGGRLVGLRIMGLPLEETEGQFERFKSIGESRKAVMDEMTKKIKEFGGAANAQVDNWTRLRRSFSSFLDIVLLGVSETGPIKSLMDTFGNVADFLNSATKVDFDPSKLTAWLGALWNLMKEYFDKFLDYVVGKVKGLLGYVAELPERIAVESVTKATLGIYRLQKSDARSPLKDFLRIVFGPTMIAGMPAPGIGRQPTSQPATTQPAKAMTSLDYFLSATRALIGAGGAGAAGGRLPGRGPGAVPLGLMPLESAGELSPVPLFGNSFQIEKEKKEFQELVKFGGGWLTSSKDQRGLAGMFRRYQKAAKNQSISELFRIAPWFAERSGQSVSDIMELRRDMRFMGPDQKAQAAAIVSQMIETGAARISGSANRGQPYAPGGRGASQAMNAVTVLQRLQEQTNKERDMAMGAIIENEKTLHTFWQKINEQAKQQLSGAGAK